jgi:plastocyanin
MPRLAWSAAGLALVAAAPSSALAADHTITARPMPNRFDPPALPIVAGDRVLLRNAGGMHNFVFEDGAEFPADPVPEGDPVWPTLERTFSAAGTYRYYCELHGALGSGMSGTITVTAATPAPGPSPSPQPNPSPSPSPEPGGGGPTPSGGQPAQVLSLSLAAKTFCLRCKRPGVRLRIDLSAPARVTGVLKRRTKRFGRVDFGTVAAGPRTLRFQRTSTGKRLTAGRYSLALSVGGAAAKTLRFRVR